MKRLRIIGLLLLALFALGAFAASTASAEEGVLPLNMKHFNILGGKAILENTEKTKITCLQLKGEGKFEKDSHGTGTLDFLECETSGFIVWSLGEKVPSTIKEALILVPILFLICLINSTTLLFGIFIELKAPIHIDNTTVGILTIVEGTVIGDILATAGVASELFLIHFTGKEGVQEFTQCKDQAEQVKKAALTSTNLEGKKLASSELTEKTLIQFLEKQLLMDT